MTASPIRVWRAPLALAGISAFGLTSSLLVDGVGDAAGWLALAVPVAVIVWFAFPWGQRARLSGRRTS